MFITASGLLKRSPFVNRGIKLQNAYMIITSPPYRSILAYGSEKVKKSKSVLFLEKTCLTNFRGPRNMGRGGAEQHESGVNRPDWAKRPVLPEQALQQPGYEPGPTNPVWEKIESGGSTQIRGLFGGFFRTGCK